MGLSCFRVPINNNKDSRGGGGGGGYIRGTLINTKLNLGVSQIRSQHAQLPNSSFGEPTPQHSRPVLTLLIIFLYRILLKPVREDVEYPQGLPIIHRHVLDVAVSASWPGSF